MALRVLPTAMAAGSGERRRGEVGETAEGHHGGVVNLFWAPGGGGVSPYIAAHGGAVQPVRPDGGAERAETEKRGRGKYLLWHCARERIRALCHRHCSGDGDGHLSLQ
jgi:hypothetical protein